MPAISSSEAVPLAVGADGVILVEGTRVPLDTVILAFQDGATPEEISAQYPTLDLAAVYQIIGYYLRHRSELDEYLSQRARSHDTTREANESRWHANGIRERLLARGK